MEGFLVRHTSVQVFSPKQVDEAAESCRSLGPAADMLRRIEEASSQTDTNPTEAQKDAGNYKKGKLAWRGLTIAIENPKGSIRRGTDKSGKKWEQEIRWPYGYLLNTEGKDKDHLDCVLGRHHQSELVFIVNQVDPATDRFDEHKIILFETNEADARQTYLDNYEEGWQGLGSIYPLTLDQFKWWLEHADTTRAIESGMFAKYRKKAGDVPDSERIYESLHENEKFGEAIHDGAGTAERSAGYDFSDGLDAFAQHGPEHRFDVDKSGRNVGTVSVMSNPDSYWLRGLYVSPRHRGKGLARKLVQQALDKFKDKAVCLSPAPFRDQAVTAEDLAKFYSKFGFKPHGEKLMRREPGDADGEAGDRSATLRERLGQGMDDQRKDVLSGADGAGSVRSVAGHERERGNEASTKDGRSDSAKPSGGESKPSSAPVRKHYPHDYAPGEARPSKDHPTTFSHWECPVCGGRLLNGSPVHGSRYRGGGECYDCGHSESLIHTKRKLVATDVTIDTEHDIPYLAGTSIEGNVVYIDKSLPRLIGDYIPAWDLIKVHETTEKHHMDEGESYQTAHKHALKAERRSCEAHGVKWEDYCKAIKPYITKAEEERDSNVPFDLEPKPYLDSGDPDPRRHGRSPGGDEATGNGRPPAGDEGHPRRDQSDREPDDRVDSVLDPGRPAGDSERLGRHAGADGPGPVRYQRSETGSDQHPGRSGESDRRDQRLTAESAFKEAETNWVFSCCGKEECKCGKASTLIKQNSDGSLYLQV
jgi:GNAT superfamily N-acetyltransferase